MSEGQNFTIYVTNIHGNICEISVNENDSITTLKSKIRQNLNIKDTRVFEISCNGFLLEEKDEETSLPNKISNYHIYNGTVVNVMLVYGGQRSNLENNNDNNKIDNQIIEKNEDEKKDSEEIINSENETKTNNEEDNEHKDDKLNSKQNLNASELNESKNSKTNLESTNEKINSQIDNYVQENVLIENYISDEIDSSSNSDENTNNDNDDDDDNDCESSQNLDHKLKEDEKIIKEKEKDEKMIKPENEIEINNSSEVNLNLNLDNKDGEINSKQNLNVSELNKNENNEKNLDSINNEICPKINDVQEDIPNKLETISANETEKKITNINGTISSNVNIGSNVSELNKKPNGEKLNSINKEINYQIDNYVRKNISGENDISSEINSNLNLGEKLKEDETKINNKNGNNENDNKFNIDHQIIKETEDNKEMIKTESNIKINNEEDIDHKSGNMETKNSKLITGILAIVDILLLAAAMVAFFCLHIAISIIFFILFLFDSFVVVVRLELISCCCISLVNLELFWTKSCINKSQSKEFNSETLVVINQENEIK